MSDNKHIDRIFQESFKDFEATPSDAVWNNIEGKLKKKKRRIIPIWWRYAGIAAILMLFLFIGGIYFSNSETNSNHQIVDVDDNLVKDVNNIDTPNSSRTNQSEYHSIANSKDLIKSKGEPSLSAPKPSVIANSKAEVVVESLVSTSSHESKSPSTEKHLLEKSIASENSFHDINNNAVATNIRQTNDFSPSEKIRIDQEKQKQPKEVNYTNSIALVESGKEAQVNKPENKQKSKSNLTIEEALEENKDIIQDNKPENRWSVAPNIAPVYFNTLNEGSSIDGQFNANSKTGDVNMSYGISTSYALNKKVRIRSGINKVNLGYNTNDVVIFQSTGRSSSALTNVNTTGNNLAVTSNQALESSTVSDEVVSTNSSINQSFGYIEVPLEIQYTFVDKRLGVNVIGGFSSFFLDNNEIYSERDNGVKTYLGEANNINEVSYSANLGLGLNYKFSKKIDLNLEPTFKYQFNTFNNTSGDFTPFFIGVYTGFAIKF